MQRFLYLLAIVATLCVLCSSCGTRTQYAKAYDGRVIKMHNSTACAAYH